MDIFKEPIVFDWDDGNYDKNLKTHAVSNQETEEVFFDPHKKLIGEVLNPNANEKRYLLLGHTKKERALFIVFTMRKNKVRVISARTPHKSERKLFQ